MPPRGPKGFEVAVVPSPGLGNATHLVATDGQAVVIDIPRDAWRVAEVAEQRGWRVTHSLETHVHNDYLSGARELRRSHDTTIVARPWWLPLPARRRRRRLQPRL